MVRTVVFSSLYGFLYSGKLPSNLVICQFLQDSPLVAAFVGTPETLVFQDYSQARGVLVMVCCCNIGLPLDLLHTHSNAKAPASRILEFPICSKFLASSCTS